MKHQWRADPLVWGHGPRVFEMFLEPTCPFSAKAFGKLDDLLAQGATIHAHDPQAMDNVRAIYGDKITLVDGMYAAAEGADALVIVTEWHEYRRPDFQRLKRVLRGAALFDGRNIWDPDELREMGFAYEGIGRRAPRGQGQSST